MIVNGKEFELKLHGKTFHCALDVTMHYVGGKWKSVVLWYLRKDSRRFGELKKVIPEISEKMLSLTLRQLEQDSLVERTVYAEVPPRVEYKLTPQGKTVLPIIEEMAAWGRKKSKEEGQMVEIIRRKSAKRPLIAS
ncbi:MAG TPA: helix-turn-helix domain-containing protein [Bacteroidia bacterium]|nr:helix-turn-helix domain-containing protein [Bacteroidia bacterium]